MKEYLFCVFLLFTSSLVFSQSADLVLLNGKIITLKEPGNTAQAVAIKADKIIAVGTNNSIKKFISAGTKVIDLQEMKTLTYPGRKPILFLI